jgi:hypothetical protein
LVIRVVFGVFTVEAQVLDTGGRVADQLGGADVGEFRAARGKGLHSDESGTLS